VVQIKDASRHGGRKWVKFERRPADLLQPQAVKSLIPLLFLSRKFIALLAAQPREFAALGAALRAG
jgi:hypothetical protein